MTRAPVHDAAPDRRRVGHRRRDARRGDRRDVAVRRSRDRPRAPRATRGRLAHGDRGGARRARRRPAPTLAAGRDPRPRRRLPADAHRGVRPHHRRGSGQADQDRARRSGSARCRRSRSPPREARRLAGEMVPIDAVRRRRGQARLHAARPHRRRRRDQPVQLPAQPRRAQGRARDRRRVPGRAQAGVADSAVGASRSPSCCSTSAGSRAGHLNVVTGGGGSVGNAHRRRPTTSRTSRSPARPTSDGASGARAAQEGRASSSATTRP